MASRIYAMLLVAGVVLAGCRISPRPTSSPVWSSPTSKAAPLPRDLCSRVDYMDFGMPGQAGRTWRQIEDESVICGDENEVTRIVLSASRPRSGSGLAELNKEFDDIVKLPWNVAADCVPPVPAEVTRCVKSRDQRGFTIFAASGEILVTVLIMALIDGKRPGQSSIAAAHRLAGEILLMLRAGPSNIQRVG